MKKMPLLKQIFIWIISPILMLWTTLTLELLMKTDINSIKKGGEVSGKKTFGCIMDLNLPKMKVHCR